MANAKQDLMVATFYKVSYEEFMKSCHQEDTPELHQIWEDIMLPRRSTLQSAGYDFFLPFEASCDSTPLVIPTGIRVKIDPGWALLLMPRSGYGTKYGMRLTNTIGLIDSDYFNAKNEGHIMASIASDTVFNVQKGDRFMQGIFVPVGLAANEVRPKTIRTGGFGSTGN